MEIKQYKSWSEFNDNLDKAVQKLDVKWKGKKVGKEQCGDELASIREFIQVNHSLITERLNINQTLHYIKTAKQLADLTKQVGKQDEYFALEMKTTALFFKNLSQHVNKTVDTIDKLKEVDRNLYLDTLAELINFRKVPIATTGLEEEVMLELAPKLTYLDLNWRSRWDKKEEKICAFPEEFIEKILQKAQNLNSLLIDDSIITDVAWAALKGYKNLQSLTIMGCLDFNQPLSELKNLQSLTINDCPAFSQSLSELKNLQKLTIILCRTFYQPLSELKNLRELRVGFCRAFNQSLSELKNLQKLEIYDNPFFNQSLSDLKNLQELAIHGCPVFNQSFSGLENLRKLRVKDCRTFNQPFFDLENLRELKIISCPDYNRSLSNLKNLRELRFEDCHAFKQSLFDLEKLQTLKIYGSPRFNRSLSDLRNLRELSVGCCRAFNQSLSELKNLQKLEIYDNPFFNQSLSGLENLQELAIHDCPVFNQSFSGLENLRELRVEDCRTFNQPFFDLENLRELKIVSCPDYNRSLSNLKNLRELRFEDCRTFNQSLFDLEKLQTLKIYGSPLFNRSLADLRNLRTLLIWGSSAFNQPISELVDLQELIIYENHAFNQSLFGLKNLQALRIRHCPELTTTPDLSGCKELSKLEIVDCNNLTEPPDLSDCPTFSLFTFSKNKKIKTFISNILEANIKQQEIEESDMSNLRKHIEENFSFIGGIFKKVREQEDLYTRNKLIAWLAYTVGVCDFLDKEKVMVIKNTGLLQDIYDYQEPRMRDGLVHSLYSLPLEKINIMSKIFVGKKKWTRLPIIVFMKMLERGMIKEDFDGLIGKIDKEREFKNINSLTALITFAKNLSVAKNMSCEDSVKLMNIVFGEKSGREKVKTLQNMDALLGLFGSEKIKQEAFKTKNPDLEKFFEVAFKEVFPISDIDNFINRYEKEIVSRGGVTSLFTYLKSVNKLPKEEKDEVLPLLEKFVDSVLRNTLSDVRYNTEKNIHLQTVFNSLSAMKKDSKGIDYIDLWKNAPAPRPIVEMLEKQEDSKEVKFFDFVNFFKAKIFTDKHLEPEDFPQLHEFLGHPEDREKNIEILKGLKGNLKKMQKEKEAESSIAKVQFQVKAIELCNPKKQVRQKETLLNELEKKREKFSDSRNFLNDVSSARSMLSPLTVEPAEYKVSETDDAWDLFLIGTIIKDSCQRVDGNPGLNKCLLAYVMDGKNKAIVVKDKREKMVARVIFRLLWDEEKKKPVLFQEKLYSNINNPKIKIAIDRWAVDRAKKLGLTLVSKDSDSETLYDGGIISLGGPAPFEYTDAGGGIKNDSIYEVTDAYVLYSPPVDV